MMMKTIHAALGVVVAFSVWASVLLLGILVIAAMAQVFMMGGFTVYHLMHS